MSRRIIVLCKYNQARSISAAAALRRFFPEYEIISAGIIAQPNIPIPSSILQILDEWNLDSRDHRSTSTLDLPALYSQDLILCADKEVKSIFGQQLRLNPEHFPYIYTLEEFANNSQEIPIDPVSMGEADTKNQLARSILLSVRAVKKVLGEDPLIDSCYLPQTRQDHLNNQIKFATGELENRLMIDTGFSIPNPALWSPELKQQLFNPMKFPTFDDLELSQNVLRSKFEIDNCPKLFLSIAYRDWLANLAIKYSLTVISPPFEELPQHRRHEAILGALHS